MYTISDPDALPYTHPEFVADPAYCNVRYDYEISNVFNAQGQITTAVT